CKGGDAADNGRELDAFLLKEILDAVDIIAALAHQGRAGAGVLAQFLDLSAWNKALTDKAVTQSVREPLSVADVCLATRNASDRPYSYAAARDAGVGGRAMRRLPIHADALPRCDWAVEILRPLGEGV